MKTLVYPFALIFIAGQLVSTSPAFSKPMDSKVTKASTPSTAPAAAAGCDGLASPVLKKNLGANIPVRKGQTKNYCDGETDNARHDGRKGKLALRLDTLIKRNRFCEEAFKKAGVSGFSLETQMTPVRQRLGLLCSNVIDYDKFSDRICAAYQGGTAQTKKSTTTELGMVSSREAYDVLAKTHGELRKSYGTYAQGAAVQAQNLEKISGMEDERDATMLERLKQLKAVMKFNEERARKLVGAKLKEREKLSGKDVGAEAYAGTVRFKDKKEVENFYRALDLCKAFSKDGGELDKWNEEYQKSVAKRLVENKKEASSFHEHFRNAASEHNRTEAHYQGLAAKAAEIDKDADQKARLSAADQKVSDAKSKLRAIEAQQEVLKPREKVDIKNRLPLENAKADLVKAEADQKLMKEQQAKTSYKVETLQRQRYESKK